MTFIVVESGYNKDHITNRPLNFVSHKTSWNFAYPHISISKLSNNTEYCYSSSTVLDYKQVPTRT